MTTVLDAAKAILLADTPGGKCAKAQQLCESWQSGTIELPKSGSSIVLPDRPARPNTPELRLPSEMKRRRLGSIAGRIALMHAIAHIEFNAIDLAADMIARFASNIRLPNEQRHAFISDWVGVCDDEARHFGLVCERLNALGSYYGALPAHDGLWQAAEATAHNILARLVIAPMVLEARGLDVTPAMITNLKRVDDSKSASVLQIIYDDEIGHVKVGTDWFHTICERESLDKTEQFHHMVRTYFKGLLKPPFNRAARDLADMPVTYYEPMAYAP